MVPSLLYNEAVFSLAAGVCVYLKFLWNLKIGKLFMTKVWWYLLLGVLISSGLLSKSRIKSHWLLLIMLVWWYIIWNVILFLLWEVFKNFVLLWTKGSYPIGRDIILAASRFDASSEFEVGYFETSRAACLS